MSDLKRYNMIAVAGIEKWRLMWIVQGPKGAIEYCHEVGAPVALFDTEWGRMGFPCVLVHSCTPLHENQKPCDGCAVLHDKCYSDGSTEEGERMRWMASAKGFEPLWDRLESLYHERFDKQEATS